MKTFNKVMKWSYLNTDIIWTTSCFFFSPCTHQTSCTSSYYPCNTLLLPKLVIDSHHLLSSLDDCLDFIFLEPFEHTNLSLGSHVSFLALLFLSTMLTSQSLAGCVFPKHSEVCAVWWAAGLCICATSMVEKFSLTTMLGSIWIQSFVPYSLLTNWAVERCWVVFFSILLFSTVELATFWTAMFP